MSRKQRDRILQQQVHFKKQSCSQVSAGVRACVLVCVCVFACVCGDREVVFAVAGLLVFNAAHEGGGWEVRSKSTRLDARG